MKRFFTLCLVMALAIAAVGCNASEAETLYVRPQYKEPVVTHYIPSAEGLLRSGFGVEQIDSLTLNMLYQVSVDTQLAEVELMYEQTSELVHVVATPIQFVDLEFNAANNEVYCDLSDLTVYNLIDGEWHVSHIAEPDTDFFSIISETFGSLDQIIYDADVVETVDGYHIVGSLSGDFVAWFFGENLQLDIESSELHAYCTYDKDNLRLRNMIFEVTQGKDFVVLDIDVVSTNSTDLTLPFEPGDIVLDDITDAAVAPSEDVWAAGAWREEDEILLSEEYFGIDYIREVDFLGWLSSEYGEVSDGVAYMVRYYMNSCSRDGFVRMLYASSPTISDEYPAAVMLCFLCEIPVANLWESGFMTQEVAVQQCMSLAVPLK